MTFQIDKKELENKEILYYYILFILDVKIEINNELKDFISFNIKNETILNKFKSKPDSSKYPIAKFSFYENGTIDKIKLPNIMNNYNAYTIIELINNTIPKLPINRSDGMINFIYIDNIDYINKKTLIEKQSPREIKKQKGSVYKKTIERDIENGYLKNIRVNSSLFLKTQKDKNQADFGLKNFSCEENSEINSTGTFEEKNIIELAKNLSEYYTFINSEDLINLLENKAIEKPNEKLNSSNYQIRKLGDSTSSTFSASSTFEIKSIDILGNKIDFKLYFGVSGEKFSAALIISANGVSFTFGSEYKGWKYSHYFGDWTLFNFIFPPIPAIQIALKAGGTISLENKINKKEPIFVINLSGSIEAKAEVIVGFDNFSSVSAGAEGTIISASVNGNINENKYIYYTGSICGGDISVYVEGTTLGHTFLKKEFKIWDGWTLNR